MDTRSTGRRGTVTSALQRGTPALLGVLVIFVLGVGALRIGQSNLRAAEADRIASRERLVIGQRANIDHYLDPSLAVGQTVGGLAKPDDAAGNADVLKRVHDDETAPALFTVLLDTKGKVLQSYPEGSGIDVGMLGSAWTNAVQGRAGMSEAFRRNGDIVTATLWPLGGDTPWGVLLAAQSPRHAPRQAFVETLGSMNAEPGGVFLTDANGTAVNVWDPARIGQPMLSAADAASVPAGSTLTVATSRQGVDTTTIATRLVDGYTFGFQQDTDKLVGDLRTAQHQRDLTLLAVLGTALAGLVIFQLARELSARGAEAKVHALLKNSQDLVVVADGHGSLTFVSPAIEDLLDQPPEQWLGRPLASVCHPDDEAQIAGLLADPSDVSLHNVRLRGGGGGAYRWFDIEASDLRRHPEVGGILLTCHEIGERKALEDELSHQATHDRLTGLPNRAQFSDHLEHLMAGGRPVRPFALLYLDLDHFKPVNDSLGHDAGDHVLVAVSQRMVHAVGRGGLVCRMGGDEFAIVLGGADVHAATEMAHRLLDAARSPITVGTSLVHLDASIGISLAEPGMELHSVEQLVRAADEAMYQAKTSGRGRFQIADPPRKAPTGAVGLVDGVLMPGAEAHAGHPITPDAGRVAAATMGTTDDSPANDFDRTAHRRLRRRSALLPTMVAGLVVVAIAGIGYGQTVAGQHRAEQERAVDATTLAARRAQLALSLVGPERLTKIADESPWSFDGGAVDQTIARLWSTAGTAGRDSAGVLIARDGRSIVQSPAELTLRIPRNGPVVQDAWEGKSGYIPWVVDADQPRSYFALPVTRNGTVVAVWLFGISATHGPGQQDLQRAGATQFANGGYSLVDGNGTIYSSWRPELIGRQFTDPANLAAIDRGEGRLLEAPGVVQVVTPIVEEGADRSKGVYYVLEVPTDEFYGDLRVGQQARDLSLLLLVLVTVAGLALVNHRREQAVRRSEERLDSLLHNAHDVVMVLDEEGRAGFVSSAIQRLLGFTADERTGQYLADLAHGEDRDRLHALVAAARTDRLATGTDLRLRDARGDYHWYDIDAVDRTDDKHIGGVLLTCHDVTDRKTLQDQLAYRARHDALTGLANRATLTERLERLTAEGANAPFAILFVDLDHFKPVNDALGHDAGDAVLRTIAERFQRQVRLGADDMDGDLVCRLGGDEFAIVINDATDLTAHQTAERLLVAAREPVAVGDRVVQVSATIGVSLSHPSRGSADQALREADLAMYQAKEAGRDTIGTAGPRA